MAIPDFQTLMLPLLSIAADEREHALRDVTEQLAQEFQLSKEERETLLPSCRQTTIANRVGWSRTFMLKAQLLESTRRGYFRITKRGLDLLKQKPQKIDIGLFEQYPEFIEFRNNRKGESSDSEPSVVEKSSEATPEESLEFAYQRLRNELADELLEGPSAGPELSETRRGAAGRGSGPPFLWLLSFDPPAGGIGPLLITRPN